MKRELRPARAALAGYPLLRRGWRVLLGAPIVLASATAAADVTPPPTGARADGQNAATPKPDAKAAPCPLLKGQMVAPAKAVPLKKPGGGKRPEPPVYDGFLGARVQRAEPPVFTLVDALAEDAGDAHHVIHPHGPDEPCTRRGG